jgi:hypothetical protein
VPEVRAQDSGTASWLPDVSSFSDFTVQILEFTYDWQDTGTPIWHSLIRRSEEMMACLDQNAVSYGVSFHVECAANRGLNRYSCSDLEWCLLVTDLEGP